MRSLAVVVVALLAVPVVAMEGDRESYCNQVDSLSNTIMERRQDGMPARDMYDAMGASSNELVEQMIEEAYEKPRYQTDEMRERTIQEFRNQWYRVCRREMSD